MSMGSNINLNMGSDKGYNVWLSVTSTCSSKIDQIKVWDKCGKHFKCRYI